jgi:hypothetical protein
MCKLGAGDMELAEEFGVDTLHDPIGLGTFGFRARVVDVLDGQRYGTGAANTKNFSMHSLMVKTLGTAGSREALPCVRLATPFGRSGALSGSFRTSSRLGTSGPIATTRPGFSGLLFVPFGRPVRRRSCREPLPRSQRGACGVEVASCPAVVLSNLFLLFFLFLSFAIGDNPLNIAAASYSISPFQPKTSILACEEKPELAAQDWTLPLLAAKRNGRPEPSYDSMKPISFRTPYSKNSLSIACHAAAAIRKR